MRPTRREALAGSAALPLLALAGVQDAIAQAPPDDTALLLGLARVEATAAASYEALEGSPRLPARDRAIATGLAGQEHDHLDALAAELKKRGAGVPPPIAPQLSKLRTRDLLLRFAEGVEQVLIAAYFDAQQKLKDERLLRLTASIMASEAQHLVVVRTAAGKPRVPEAFETGGR